MRKTTLLKTLLVAVSMLLGGANSVWAQDAGTYYIQNVGTGKWLAPANSWETQASVLNHADKWVLAKVSEGVYTLESVVSNGSGKIYLNGGYCDGATNNLTFTAIGGKTNTYSIKEGTKYYTTDGTTVTASADDAGSENAQWKLFSASDLTTAMASATPASGVDATWLILDHNLSRNNRNYSSWSNTGATTPKTSDKTESASSRYSIEAFQKTFDVHQALTSIPNGVYGVQVNSFYRQDGSDSNLPYVYAGSNKTTIQSRGSGTENTMQTAAASFIAGNYLSNRAAALVTDGNLTVGVATEGTSCWTIFKNFHLTYYGNPTVANPLDMTSWIVNPGMEEDGACPDGTYKRDITGWSHNNSTGNYRSFAIPAENNTSEAFTGTYCAEIWNGSSLSGKKIYQVVTGLPNGVYKFQLAAMVAQGTATITNEFVYASSNGQSFTKRLGGTVGQSADYELYAIVSDGTLEIGLDMNTSGCNWACIDNARLTYYGASDEAFELVSEDLASSHVIPVPSTYSLSNAEDTNPFDAGTYKSCTNVTALNVNNTTATAWFGSTEKPVILNDKEAVTISFTAFHGYYPYNQQQGVKLLNSNGNTIVEYIYNPKGLAITDVKIGGSTVTGFTGALDNVRSMNTASKGADGFDKNIYQSTTGYNPIITFSLRYDGYVTVSIYRGQGNYLYTYMGKLPEGWAVDLQKIQIHSNFNNDNRTIAINDLKVERRFAYDVTAVDGSGNELTKVFRGAAATDGSTTAYWNKYIKVDDQWYETTGSYGKSITTAENKVTYAASNIDYFVEAEKMTGYSAAVQYIGTAYSGGIRGRHGENTNWSMGISISEAGPYTISFPHKYDSSSSASTLTLTEVKSDESETQIEEKSISSDGTYTKDYDFSAGSDLKISKGTGNSNYMIDYVTLTKKAVTYTVKYMCGETEIKTADDSRTAKWGTTVAIEDADKANIFHSGTHATYQYASDDASSQTIAADGSTVITVEFTQIPLYTQTNVIGKETWDWSVIKSTDGYGDLSSDASQLKDIITDKSEFVLKNTELYGTTSGTAYSIPDGFGDAQKLTVQAQHPFRYEGSKGYFQGYKVKFYSEVPGTIDMSFSSTGSKTRDVYVNASKTAYTSSSTTKVDATGMSVAKGDIEIKGMEGSNLALLRIYTITFTPTLNTAGYSTFSSNENIQVTGANAYTAVLDYENETITCTKIADGKIPAGNGVILFGDGTEPVVFTTIGSAPALGENDLKATTLADGSLASKSENTYYVLNGSTFKKYTGAAFGAGKAYFEVSGDEVLSRSFTMVFENEATGISDVRSKIEDVRGFYDLQGRRVAQPAKGLYIENGKKVIIK